MEEDAQKSNSQSEAGDKNSKWEQEMRLGELDQNSLKTEEAKHEKEGPDETLHLLANNGEDEHKTRTSNVVISEKSKPMSNHMLILFIITLRVIFSWSCMYCIAFTYPTFDFIN